jgi:hypothetical protein
MKSIVEVGSFESECETGDSFSLSGFRLVRSLTELRTRREFISPSSQLYQLCQLLCSDRGDWTRDKHAPQGRGVEGFNLVAVESIIHDGTTLYAFKARQAKLSRLKLINGEGEAELQANPFCMNISSYDFRQRRMWAAFQSNFHVKPPVGIRGNDPYSPDSFYCFHGPRREHLGSVCENGMVGVRLLNEGNFGTGCYSTLNIEYALHYVRGDHDQEPRRAPPRDGLYAVLLMCGLANKVYPVTPHMDYHFFLFPLGAVFLFTCRQNR